MKLSILLAGAVLAAAFAAPALAQESPTQRAASFDKADVNKDGKLTKAEWVASIPENARAHVDDAWKRMDPDNKGFMTKDAYVSFNGIPHGVGTVLPAPHN